MATIPQNLENLNSLLEFRFSVGHLILERMMGIEPTLPAWEAGVLPLNYIRDFWQWKDYTRMVMRCQIR